MRVRLGKQARSVSIVGVGCTPFKNFKGMSEGDAFGYAALEAVRDAGLQPRDVQYFYHGAANPFMIGDSLTPNMQVADWFGVRGIGSVHHSEARKAMASPSSSIALLMRSSRRFTTRSRGSSAPGRAERIS